VDGTPLPNAEETGKKVIDPQGKYRPMVFGPIGRAWPPRVKYAGTYDQKWLDEVMPVLPRDFDERSFQAAPEDQQTDYLRGGEEVELLNLTPEGKTKFRIPTVEVPVEFSLHGGDRKEFNAPIDTVVIEPDERRFLVVWRANLPLRRNLFEISEVVAGRMSRAGTVHGKATSDITPTLRSCPNHG